MSVRIPGEDDGAFTPKVTPKASDKKVEEKKVEEKKVEEKRLPPVVEQKKAPDPKPEVKPAQAERARAEAALGAAEYFVPVGAFANPDSVIDKLTQAKLRHYTEKVPTAKGTVTRVRAGPFATRDEADKAMEALKELGFKPGSVGTKAG